MLSPKPQTRRLVRSVGKEGLIPKRRRHSLGLQEHQVAVAHRKFGQHLLRFERVWKSLQPAIIVEHNGDVDGDSVYCHVRFR